MNVEMSVTVTHSLPISGGSKDEEDVADDQDQEGGDGAPPEPWVVGQVLSRHTSW